MLTFAMLNVLTGAVLGQRFKVFVLVLTSAIMMAAVVGFESVRGDRAWWAIVMALVGNSLQVGCFVGIVIQHMLLSGRHQRVSASVSSARPRPVLDSRD